MFNAALLAEIRSAQRYSQRTLALTAGVSASFVAALEAGNSEDPGHLKLAKVSKVLGVSPDVFFEELAENFTQRSKQPSGPSPVLRDIPF